jgi:hypothetical protein
MKIATLAFIGGLMLLVIVPKASCDVTHPARPGSINYVEGQAAIGSQVLGASSVGVLELSSGQTLTTQAGKVEILLTPGVFLRLADNSSLRMISPALANTEVALEEGRAIIEAIDIHKENSIRIDQNSGTITLLKNGLYDFDADHSQVRVFSGELHARLGIQEVKVKGKHMTLLVPGRALKSDGFETQPSEDEFYRWSALRSSYLSEASIDTARTYAGPSGWYGPGWGGWGWYWNPWFGSYTFVPANGIFWAPFGWGFYSPFVIYRSPYFYGPHIYHRFDQFHGPYGHGYAPPRRGLRR